MKLKLQTLIDKGACTGQVDLFRNMFGDSVNVTQKLCVSVSDKFDFGWAARHLLKPLALDEYDRVTASALAEYDRVGASALAEGARLTASVGAGYYRVRASAFAKGYNS